MCSEACKRVQFFFVGCVKCASKIVDDIGLHKCYYYKGYLFWYNSVH